MKKQNKIIPVISVDHKSFDVDNQAKLKNESDLNLISSKPAKAGIQDVKNEEELSVDILTDECIIANNWISKYRS